MGVKKYHTLALLFLFQSDLNYEVEWALKNPNTLLFLFLSDLNYEVEWALVTDISPPFSER